MSGAYKLCSYMVVYANIVKAAKIFKYLLDPLVAYFWIN